MSIKTYKSTDRTQLTEHFNVSEFRCKCGGNHDTKLDETLVEKLEKLHTALNCSQIVVTSGYRCPTHSVNVGGSATDYHTKGYAADIECYDQNGNKISSKKVSCVAQDLGFGGIANIGNAQNKTYTATHVDTRTSNYWKGDEVKTSAYSVTDDFYKYYGLTKSDVYPTSTVKKSINVTVTVDGTTYSGTIAEK